MAKFLLSKGANANKATDGLPTPVELVKQSKANPKMAKLRAQLLKTPVAALNDDKFREELGESEDRFTLRHRREGRLMGVAMTSAKTRLPSHVLRKHTALSFCLSHNHRSGPRKQP